MHLKLKLEYSENPSEIATSLLLRHNKARRPRTERFIVDTGSPISIISQLTATQMQIKDSVLNYNKPMGGIGGETFHGAEIYNVKFNLKGEENNYEGKHTFTVNPRSRENLLGMDFIEAHNLKLVVDRNDEKKAYFKRKGQD